MDCELIDPREQTQAKNDVTQIAAAITAYQAEYHDRPTGDTARILKTLEGDNPRKIVFLEIEPKYLNKDREFVDSWRTPYVCGIRNNKAWAYSFGPNKIDEGGRSNLGGGRGDDINSWE